MELFYFLNSPEDKENLNILVKKVAGESGSEFLQSFEWGEFLNSEGEEIIRFGVREKGNILLAATLVKKTISKNIFYWYSPRGPITTSKAVVFNFFIKELKKIDSRALFLRFEPLDFKDWLVENEEDEKLSYKKTINLQPAKTLILNLKKSEEELLAEMHQKTRYNIRLAEKKGVVIKEGNSSQVQEFWRLLKATSERDDFRLHPLSHYEKLLSLNDIAPGFIRLFFAEFEGKRIASGIFSFYGNKVTYLHGASDNESRNLMAPYLLQWHLICEAKKEAYNFYDFYGIDEKKWPGVTRFKTGFGGRIFEYAGTYDIIFKPLLYRFYELFRILHRRIK